MTIEPTLLARRRITVLRFAAGGAALLALAGCITSEAPVFDSSQKPFGDAATFQFYSLRDGTAHDPIVANLRWTGKSYSVAAIDIPEGNALSFHALDGGSLVVQSIDGRPGRPVDYAIARPIADGVYLINPIDEDDADSATREKFCTSPSVCRVTTPDQVIGLARASAAKRQTRGGLAIRVADEH